LGSVKTKYVYSFYSVTISSELKSNKAHTSYSVLGSDWLYESRLRN